VKYILGDVVVQMNINYKQFKIHCKFYNNLKHLIHDYVHFKLAKINIAIVQKSLIMVQQIHFWSKEPQVNYQKVV